MLVTYLLTLALLQGNSQKLDAPVLYERAKSAVVHITAVDAAGQVKGGSGVILRSDGLLATNYHVIKGAVSARVQLLDGDIYDDVAIADTDERKDLALLKIKAAGLSALTLADLSDLRVGTTVYVLGAPLGLEGSLSQGLVSALRPATEINAKLEGFRVIQFTAPVSAGSSGGPLIDETGRVVGLVSATLPAGQNVNIAIPAIYISGLVANWTEASQNLEKMPPKVESVPARPPAEIVASAKTLCVLLASGSPVLKTEISGKLLKWGRLTLVPSPNDADLVLEVVQTGELNTLSGAGNQATALLKDNASGVALWSTTKGGSWAWSGWSNAWVARAIADQLIKFFDSTRKGQKK
jgi:hypothetical protein